MVLVGWAALLSATFLPLIPLSPTRNNGRYGRTGNRVLQLLCKMLIIKVSKERTLSLCLDILDFGGVPAEGGL